MPLNYKSIATFAAALAALGLAQAAHAAIAPYSTTVLSRSPLLYWQLDETSGTSAADATGNGNTGTYGTGVTLGVASASPVLATAVQSPGVTGSSVVPVELTNVSNINAIGTGSFSIEFWVNTSKNNAREDLFDFRGVTGSPVSDLGITVDTANTTAAAGQLSVFHTTGTEITDTATLVTTNAWHLVTLTRDGTSGAETLYLDGASVGTATDTQTVNVGTPASGVGLALGNKVSGAAHQFLGSLDELAIYNSVLTPDQISSDYDVGLGVPEPASIGLLALGAAALLARRRAR